MELEKAKTLLGDETLTEDSLSVLLDRARKLAKNQHYWKTDDEPTQAELDKFYDRYEYEILEIAKEIKSSHERGGLKEFSELGVTRKWGGSGTESIEAAVSSIPPKTYVL